MSGLEDVMKIAKKLDKMVSSGTADDASSQDLLNALKRFPMTVDILQKTKVGVSVNNFRKASSNDSVVTLSKSLIKQWKKLVPGDAGSSSQSQSQSSLNKSGSTTSLPRSNSTCSNKDEDSMDSSTASEQRRPDTPTSPGAKPDFKRQTSFPATGNTTDSVRLKCRELLTNALKTPPMVDHTPEPEDVAAAIEDCIYQEFKNTDMKYKNRIRSRIANLKDQKNPDLRHSVMQGLIPPDRIACMTAEEMASNELKQLRAKFTKEAIDDHQMVQQGGTKTDLFKCGRCGKRHCSYNQVQTRSADEPMTTFVLCNECGNRWKFC